MSFVHSWLVLLWAQAPAPNPVRVEITPELLVRLRWLFLLSDPAVTSNNLAGGLLTWLKAISLICLVCWVASWLLTGVKQGLIGRGRWFD